MNIGDKVRPLSIIYVSNKQMMCEWEEGTIVNIILDEDEYRFFVVRRDRDNKIFKAGEHLWGKV